MAASPQTPTTWPPSAPDEKPHPGVFRSERQTFLVGDTIFLRGLEPEDAQRASAWRNSPYPISAERAGEIIKEMHEKSAPGKQLWVACRRSDGVPVGSVRMNRWSGDFVQTSLSLYADPALPGADEITAEILRIVVEWGFGEAEVPLYVINVPADQLALKAAAESIGMHHDAMHREQWWRDGAWRAGLRYSIGHPAWRRRLGDPGPGIAHAMATDDPARWRPRQHPTFGTLDGTPPTNAVMVGPRVYLRPLELSDASTMVAIEREEPETFMDNGRQPGSVEGYRNWFRAMGKEDPPGTVAFAVCRRSDDRLIGMNAVSSIDRVNRTGETESWFYHGIGRDQGFGTEAKHLLLAYAFDRLGLHSMRSMVWGPNGRSAAALIKQGYREAGRTPWAGTKHGEYTYFRHFDLLADEWREANARAGTAT
jgi:RimJ/RimL family protein N-acetyltransferase